MRGRELQEIVSQTNFLRLLVYWLISLSINLSRRLNELEAPCLPGIIPYFRTMRPRLKLRLRKLEDH